MKTKTIVAFIIILFSFPVVKSQTSFGILGGVNLQNMTEKEDGDKIENNLKTGFHVGFNAQIPIVPEFYFQPGLLFSTKGTKIDDDPKTTINLSYIELPLNVVYKGALGKGYVLLGLGPYLAYGIGGKVKEGDQEADIEFKSSVSAGDPAAFYLKAFDAGGNIFAGYECPYKVFVQLNTQFGMINLLPEYDGSTDSNSSLKNIGFGLSVGYRF